MTESNLEEPNNDEVEDDVEDVEYIPRIVILGAGPIGIESALYARYLGYEVAVIERGTIANNVKRWGHVRMFSPFSMNHSSLGAAALAAQHEDLSLPAEDSLLTGDEFAEQYLFPLSKTDLVRGCVHENVEAIRIGRDGILKTDAHCEDVDRSGFRFRVLVRMENGDEDVIEADAVIDTTGVFDQPNFLGHGGIPAVGELACRMEICFHVPDVIGADRSRYENKRVLVIGSGYSAATNVVALQELASQATETKVTWVTRRDSPARGPIPVAENDRLQSRAELANNANTADVRNFDQTSVIAIYRDDANGEFTVTLGGKLSGEHVFDEVIANVGYRPNADLYSELQLDICSNSQAPRRLAAWLSEQGQVDALDHASPGVDILVQPEPNFFVIGSKSFGRNSNFLLALGLKQIRDVFTVIAGRESLDLYQTMAK